MSFKTQASAANAIREYFMPRLARYGYRDVSRPVTPIGDKKPELDIVAVRDRSDDVRDIVRVSLNWGRPAFPFFDVYIAVRLGSVANLISSALADSPLSESDPTVTPVYLGDLMSLPLLPPVSLPLASKPRGGTRWYVKRAPGAASPVPDPLRHAWDLYEAYGDLLLREVVGIPSLLAFERFWSPPASFSVVACCFALLGDESRALEVCRGALGDEALRKLHGVSSTTPSNLAFVRDLETSIRNYGAANAQR